MPRSCVTRADASASSFGDDGSGGTLRHLLQQRQHVADVVEFFS